LGDALDGALLLARTRAQAEGARERRLGRGEN
jgi:hypothetical protein